MADSKLEAFVQNTLRLLQTERDEEIHEAAEMRSAIPLKELQSRGVVLLNMRIQDVSSGLGGRTMMTFHLTFDRPLPAHRFSQGDIVGIRPTNAPATEEMSTSGVVYRLNEKTITIACDAEAADSHIEEPVILFKLANDVTFNRMKKAMDELRSLRVDHPSYRLLQVIFSDMEPLFGVPKPIESTNKNLNQPQLDAISFALSARDVALIHGPPGTGKTTTVVELIVQAVKQGRRVLACAPSNVAVDNLAERLVPHAGAIKFVRLGHPARILPSVIPYTLDSLINKAEGTEIVADVKKELDMILKSFAKVKDRSEIFRLRGEVKTLRKELRMREKKVVEEVLSRVQVVLATNIGVELASSEYLPRFDLVVIDEAAQALEASCWIPILKTSTVILAGDHQQLPPTVKSKEAEKNGLGITLFDRLNKLYGEKITHLLNIQYRMNEKIMKWSSDAMYEGKLVAHSSVASHLLSDLSGVCRNAETDNTLVFIDTAGCGYEESRESYGDSTYNEGEVSVVSKYIECLILSGLPAKDIAVITPYNAQVEKLREVIREKYPAIEIDTVDGFQGREKEAVVISLVRSNDKREVGFLSDERRMNVAVTRARRHAALIGDSDTISSNKFLGAMFEYFSANGDYRSATSPEIGQSPEEADALAKSMEGLALSGSDSSSTKQAKVTKSIKPKPQAKPTKAGNSGTSGAQEKSANKPQTTERTPFDAAQDPESLAFEQSTRQKIVDFQSSNEKSLAFPPTLDSRERLIVHQLAEELGLLHVSKGEGNARFITLSKKGVVTCPQPTKVVVKDETIASKTSDKAKSDTQNSLSAPPTRQSSRYAGIASTDDNEDDDSDTNESTQETDTQQQSAPITQDQKSTKSTKKKGNASGSTDPQKRPLSVQEAKAKKDLEFEELLKQYDPNSCAFPKCGKVANVVGVNCMHCRKRYCLAHNLAEIHGCGDAAKKVARTEWADRYARAYQEQKQQALYGTSTDPKPLKGVQRNAVQKKLQEKVFLL
eukprot:TRINITY_DN3900_c0_g1_i1.p1 TRINITY_DN3900_c0_g1~~TRINITY_DN3900_c0_g1_i1.p1  ORF type:complete len:1003 (+),score=233.75 TRINITY_DN3900_c0_g1_i1:48-3056(+)